MKKSKIREAQIVAAIKEYEVGKMAADIYRVLGVHQATFYNWKSSIRGTRQQTGPKSGRATLHKESR